MDPDTHCSGVELPPTPFPDAPPEATAAPSSPPLLRCLLKGLHHHTACVGLDVPADRTEAPCRPGPALLGSPDPTLSGCSPEGLDSGLGPGTGDLGPDHSNSQTLPCSRLVPHEGQSCEPTLLSPTPDSTQPLDPALTQVGVTALAPFTLSYSMWTCRT